MASDNESGRSGAAVIGGVSMDGGTGNIIGVFGSASHQQPDDHHESDGRRQFLSDGSSRAVSPGNHLSLTLREHGGNGT